MPLRGMTVDTYDVFAVCSRTSRRSKWSARAMSRGVMTPRSVEPESTGMCRFPETDMSARASSNVSEGVRKTSSLEEVIFSRTVAFQPDSSAAGSKKGLDESRAAAIHRRRSRCVMKPTMRSFESFTQSDPTFCSIMMCTASEMFRVCSMYLAGATPACLMTSMTLDIVTSSPSGRRGGVPELHLRACVMPRRALTLSPLTRPTWPDKELTSVRANNRPE
mmetsp:Transcript_1396/g.3952  ORF Transcript_1396/g.3952 Transcript_1396/m.3952 type:complete len:220 (-) Transcript_1396:79-738(-)